MPKSFSAELGAWKASVERRLDNLASGNRLDHASLDGTTLYLKGDGQLGRIGRQPDGSNGVHVVKVQPPPQLTAAILTVGEQAGTCLVEWDGNTFDGRRMPLIHGHTEIWAELVDADWSPTVAPGDTAKRVGTIRDRTGGEVVVALPQAGVWAVWLRAMGADRETAGPWSPVSQAEIVPLVDTDAIEAELEEARDRLEQAEQDLAAGMADRVAEIEHLREVRIPALQDALTTGLDDVYRDAQVYAEAQADDAVNRAAADAQSEYDRLQEIAERALSRAGDNVVEDPSFETDSHYWAGEWNGQGGRLVRITNNPNRTGNRALVIEGGDDTSFTLGEFNADPGQSYRLQIWQRTWNSNLADLPDGSRLQILNTDTGDVLAESDEFVQTNSFVRATVILTVEDHIASLTPVIRAHHDSGLLILDDVSFQEVGAAAEALRLAEVARQQAEAAHLAAGNAVDTAANAYDAASSKSSVHWSLSAPSGTGASTDDVWWQYELRNGRRVVTGQWFWDNGVWRETEIAEEWLPLVNIGTGTYGDLSGDRLEAHTVRTNHLLVGPQNLITDPDFDTINDGNRSTWENINGEWYVSGTSGATGRPVLRISDADAQNSVAQQVRYGSGPGASGIIPCTPGETYKFSFNVLRYPGALDSDDYRAQFRWSDAGMNTIAWSTSNWGSASAGERLLLEATAPDGAAYFYVRFYKVGEAGAARGVSLPTLEKMTDTSLIVQGAVKSRSVDTEEFFAATAVIEAIWTDIVRSRLIQSEGIITEDMIATGAITTPKLTVTEEMVGEVARLLRIEAGSLASNDIEAMRIVSSLIEATTYLIHNADGDVSVRLDGMSNYIAGRLHAGMNEETGIELDHGSKTRRRGLTDEGGPADVWTIQTPYINFTSGRSYEQDGSPSIYIDEGDDQDRDGMMIINPGYPVGTQIFRAKLNVVGDVQANMLEARNQVRTPVGYRLNTGSSSQPGGIVRDGARTRFEGRLPDSAGRYDTLVHGSSGDVTLSAGTASRGSITYGAPTETGSRRPIVSAHVANADWGYDNWRGASASSAGASASGFRFVVRADTSNTGNVQVWLYYTALWV